MSRGRARPQCILPHVVCVEGNIGSGQSNKKEEEELPPPLKTLLCRQINSFGQPFLCRIHNNPRTRRRAVGSIFTSPLRRPRTMVSWFLLKAWKPIHSLAQITTPSQTFLFRSFAWQTKHVPIQMKTHRGFCFQMEVIDWFRQLHYKSLKNRPEHVAKKMNKKLRKLHENEEDLESKEESCPITPIEESNDCLPLELLNNVSSEGSTSSYSFSQPISSPLPSSKIFPKLEVSPSFIIVERSAMSSFEIFARNLMDGGFMSEWEYSLLQRYYSLVDWQPQYILYIR